MSTNDLLQTGPEAESRPPEDPLLDVTPRESVLELLSRSGGQLTERQLVSEVGHSTAACRRVLAELETDGELECRETGRDRMVCLTDARPATSVGN